MDTEFKGTKGKWSYQKPTSRFDACTVSESGKIIGYCAKNSQEDRANEKIRSVAPELLEQLKIMYDLCEKIAMKINSEDFNEEFRDEFNPIMRGTEILIQKSTEI